MFGGPPNPFNAGTPLGGKPGGLFGAATPGAPAANLFGTPAPAGGGASLFGATPAAKPAANLFGTPAPAGGGAGLFGAAGTPAPASNMFSGQNMFGAATPAAPAGGLFGAPAPAANPFGAQAPAQAAQAAQAAAMRPQVTDSQIFTEFMRQFEAAYNAGRPQQCSFKHIFYDDMTGLDGKPPRRELLAQKRQQAQAQADPALWERADARNPDPARFCPVQVTGFENLHMRQRVQEEMSEKLKAHLENEVVEPLKQMANERQVNIEMRLRHYRARQQQLAHRVLALTAKLEAQQHMRNPQRFDPRQSEAERAWATRLEQLARALRDPTHGRPKLLELSGTHQLRGGGGGGGGGGGEGGGGEGGGGASHVNAEAVREWLSTQQAGLDKLVQVQNELLEDCAVLQDVQI